MIRLLAVLAFFCAGCGGPAFRPEIIVEANEKGWSEKQRKAASAYAYTFFLASQEENKDKSPDLFGDNETKAKLAFATIKYNLLSLDRLVTRIDQWLEDFDLLLGYSMPEEVKYVDTFGLRATLAHDEKVMKAVRARVQASLLDRNFKAMLGQLPAEFADIDCLNGYNIRTIFGPKNPLDSFKFNVDQIDEARKAGTLKQIEHCKMEVTRKFDHKEQDPNNLKDGNAYIWLSNSQELELSTYKIIYNDKPKDNIGNYIEGFRWNNGKREGRPCLKVFMLNSEDPSPILVIDTKREGEPGFGLPDFVEKRAEPVSAQELIHDENLIGRLFKIRKENKRVPPKSVQIYVEIAKSEEPIDVWETAIDKNLGFVVPFRYRNTIGSNFNVRVELSRMNIGNANPDPIDIAMSVTIKHIKKEWTKGTRFESSLGSVVEYYKAKPPYDKMKLLSLNVVAFESTKKLSLVKEDGSTETGFVKPGHSKYIEDNPIAILYTEGEKRYIIKRTSSSGVFDKRKELSTEVPEETGVYEDSGNTDSPYGTKMGPSVH